MKEAQVSDVQLLKPGEYPAKLLHLVDGAFGQVTLPVQAGVAGLGFFPVGAQRNYRAHVPVQDVLTEPLGIISLVGNHVLPGITGCQPPGLIDAAPLAPGQDEPQGIAQAVHAHADLGAEPAPAPSQGLRFLAAFWGALRRHGDRPGPLCCL